MLEYTDIMKRDANNVEPHQIKLKNIKDTFRLSEFLVKMYEKQSNSK